MLDGLATRFVDGFPAGAPTLQRALSEFRRIEKHRTTETIWVWLAVELFDADAWFELGTRQVATSAPRKRCSPKPTRSWRRRATPR
jgi:hypothetical protein